MREVGQKKMGKGSKGGEHVMAKGVVYTKWGDEEVQVNEGHGI